jgi:hypothetical protein
VNTTNENSTQRFWTGARLIGLGVGLALLLILARYGPYLARRVGIGSGGGQGATTGQLRPTQWIEDGLASVLATFLVEKPPAGEAITPKIHYEQPWPEWLFLLVAAAGIGAIVWLYRREGAAPKWARITLTGLRIALLLLVMLLLSEFVLHVDRTGLPTFVVLIDDSASAQIADPYPEPLLQAEARELAKAAGRDSPDRLSLALGWLARDDAFFVKRLAEHQKIKFYRVSEAAVSVAEVERPDQVSRALTAIKKLQPNGSESRLGDAVASVLSELRGSPPTAILFLTDGQTTDGAKLSEASELARKSSVPLFTVGLGDERPARDLALSDLQVDDFVFVGDTVRFVARLTARGFDAPGAAPGRSSANVTLKRAITGTTRLETLETLRVTLAPENQPLPFEISHRPTEVGTITYVLEVTPDPRELQRGNNRLERTIEVRDQKLKVLYVEGEPRYEFRWLKTYLERDNSIDLSVLLQSADDRYAEQDRSAIGKFPGGDESPKGLYSYDVVILGDVDPDLMNTQQMRDLAEFVTRKGGGLLLLAGEAHNPLSFRGKPLESLLPIRLEEARNPGLAGPPIEPFQVALTPEGRANPIFRLGDDEASSRAIWSSLSPMYWYFEAPRKQPTAVVLAEHPGKQGVDGNLPLIVYHYAGAGRVLFCGVDESWRFRLRLGDQLFGRYWVQMLRFLARSKLIGQKQVEVATDRSRYNRGQNVQAQVRFLNPSLAQGLKSATARLASPARPPQVISLRPMPGNNPATVFEATLSGLAEGTYTVTYMPPPAAEGEPPGVSFQIDPPAGEYLHIEMNKPELVAAARLTGGQFFRWDERKKPVAPAPEAGSNAQRNPGEEETPDPNVSTGPANSEPPPKGQEKTLAELLPAPQKVPLESDPPIVLWNTWPPLVVFLVLITTEWVLRKRMQLA